MTLEGTARPRWAATEGFPFPLGPTRIEEEGAESLASENATRLAAMQRAEKNIDELLEDLKRTFHRLHQSGIDEELFDVVSGFETLAGP